MLDSAWEKGEGGPGRLTSSARGVGGSHVGGRAGDGYFGPAGLETKGNRSWASLESFFFFVRIRWNSIILNCFKPFELTATAFSFTSL